MPTTKLSGYGLSRRAKQEIDASYDEIDQAIEDGGGGGGGGDSSRQTEVIEVPYHRNIPAPEGPDGLKFGDIVRDTGREAIYEVQFDTGDDDADLTGVYAIFSTYGDRSDDDDVGVYFSVDGQGDEPVVDDVDFVAVALSSGHTHADRRNAFLAAIQNDSTWSDYYEAWIGSTEDGENSSSVYLRRTDTRELPYPEAYWPWNINVFQSGIDDTPILWQCINPSDPSDSDNWLVLGPFDDELADKYVDNWGVQFLDINAPNEEEDYHFCVNWGMNNPHMRPRYEIVAMTNTKSLVAENGALVLNEDPCDIQCYVLNAEAGLDVILNGNMPRETHTVTVISVAGVTSLNVTAPEGAMVHNAPASMEANSKLEIIKVGWGVYWCNYQKSQTPP